MSDLRIVLLGKTGSGKSSTGNTILGRYVFKAEYSLDSVTESCQVQEVGLGKRIISVTDTPGLFDTSMTEEELKSEIMKCVEMSVPGPHVFLLVIRLDVRNTEEEMNTVKWIQENFGEDAVKYTMILFTHSDVLKNKTLEEYVKASNALINQYGSRYHSFNNNDRENQGQVRKLLEMIDEMVQSNRGMYFTNDMYREAQRRIDQENFQRRRKEKAKTALTVVGVGTCVVGIAGVVAAISLGGPEAVTKAAGSAAAAAAGSAAAAAAGSAAAATGSAAAAGLKMVGEATAAVATKAAGARL